MPRFNDVVEMVRVARQHVDETGHEVMQADTPTQMILGFACVDCGDDPTTLWECRINAIASIPEGHPMRDLVRTGGGRVALLQQINQNARNPMLVPGDIADEPEPTADELARLAAVWGPEAQAEDVEKANEELRKLDEARRLTRFDRLGED